MLTESCKDWKNIIKLDKDFDVKNKEAIAHCDYCDQEHYNYMPNPFSLD